jgi:hypothetical protein
MDSPPVWVGITEHISTNPRNAHIDILVPIEIPDFYTFCFTKIPWPDAKGKHIRPLGKQLGHTWNESPGPLLHFKALIQFSFHFSPYGLFFPEELNPHIRL